VAVSFIGGRNRSRNYLIDYWLVSILILTLPIFFCKSYFPYRFLFSKNKMFKDYEKIICLLYVLVIALAPTRNMVFEYKGNNSCKIYNLRIKSEM